MHGPDIECKPLDLCPPIATVVLMAEALTIGISARCSNTIAMLGRRSSRGQKLDWIHARNSSKGGVLLHVVQCEDASDTTRILLAVECELIAAVGVAVVCEETAVSCSGLRACDGCSYYEART